MVLAASVLLATSANAADYGSIPMAQPVMRAAEAVTEYASNWYLRGDIAYRANSIKSSDVLIAPNAVTNRAGEAFGGGLGMGYSAGWFRADVTVDYAGPWTYQGDTSTTTNYFEGRIGAFTALVNGYIDMGTWAGFTPYVGAGIGASMVRTSGFADLGVATTTAIQNTSHWNVAWAYMAGVSYRISNNFLIDVGYRHLELGEARTGVDSNGNRLTLKNLSSDEVRVGARYQID